MKGYPSREIVASIRENYPKGTRVALVCMNDPYTKLRPGDTGTVMFVDDIGTVHIQWSNGSMLGAVYGEDAIRRIE